MMERHKRFNGNSNVSLCVKHQSGGQGGVDICEGVCLPDMIRPPAKSASNNLESPVLLLSSR